MNIKYTGDGRKVHVDSKLNENEYIIQEILIKNGKEVLGDKKTVIAIGQLHDELPDVAKTWKERRLEEIEKQYEKFYNQKESELNDLIKKHRFHTKILKEKLKFIQDVCDNVRPELFQMVEDYISGKFKYFVITDYSVRIVDMDYINETYDGELRLISIFGKADGTLSYAQGQYSDYSGGKTKITPCKTYKDAVKCVSDYLNSQISVGQTDIDRATEYGVKIKPELLEKFKAGQRENLLRQLSKCDEERNKTQAALDKLETL